MLYLCYGKEFGYGGVLFYEVLSTCEDSAFGALYGGEGGEGALIVTGDSEEHIGVMWVSTPLVKDVEYVSYG